jgi:hypothetical protein
MSKRFENIKKFILSKIKSKSEETRFILRS